MEKQFVCKRCKRAYAYPAVDERPIRCECGWWYFNDGVKIVEAFWQSIEPYRNPPPLGELFKFE